MARAKQGEQSTRERGYKGTTLAMIQKRAGVHPGSFYWHFEDKDALFAALVRYAYEDSATMVNRLGAGDASNPVKAVLDAIVQNPARFGLWRFNVQLMLDPDMRESRTADEIRTLREITQQALTGAWLEHMPERVLAEVPQLPGRMADYALATVEGCILSRIAGTVRDEEFITALATFTMDRMVQEACEEVGESVPAFFRQRSGVFRELALGDAKGVVDAPEGGA